MHTIRTHCSFATAKATFHCEKHAQNWLTQIKMINLNIKRNRWILIQCFSVYHFYFKARRWKSWICLEKYIYVRLKCVSKRRSKRKKKRSFGNDATNISLCLCVVHRQNRLAHNLRAQFSLPLVPERYRRGVTAHNLWTVHTFKDDRSKTIALRNTQNLQFNPNHKYVFTVFAIAIARWLWLRLCARATYHNHFHSVVCNHSFSNINRTKK